MPNPSLSPGQRLLKAIVEERPALGRWLEASGDLPLQRYAATLFGPAGEPAEEGPGGGISDRALGIFEAAARNRFGDGAARRLAAQLATAPVVNTAEHLAPLFHPRRFQSNLLAACGAAGQGFDCLPVLACSAIPLSNAAYSRGILWSGERVSLFSERRSKALVWSADPVAEDDLAALPRAAAERAGFSRLRELVPEIEATFDPGDQETYRHRIRRALATGQTVGLEQFLAASDLVPEQVGAVLEALPRAEAHGEEVGRSLRDLVLTAAPDRMLASPRWADQASLWNAALWRRAVAVPAGELAGEPPPWASELIYLTTEDITTALLRESLAAPDGDLMGALLLDPPLRRAALEAFEGVQGSWDDSGRGTQLFWGIDRRGRMIPLRVSDEALVAAEDEGSAAGFRVPLTARALTEALEARRIVPGVLLNTAPLMDHGLRCLGGPNQVQYAPLIEAGLGDLEERFGRSRTARREPAGWVVSGPLFFFEEGSEAGPSGNRGALRPGSMEDFLRRPRASRRRAAAALERLRLREASLAGLLDLYPVLVPPGARRPELESLTLDQVLEGLPDLPAGAARPTPEGPITDRDPGGEAGGDARRGASAADRPTGSASPSEASATLSYTSEASSAPPSVLSAARPAEIRTDPRTSSSPLHPRSATRPDRDDGRWNAAPSPGGSEAARGPQEPRHGSAGPSRSAEPYRPGGPRPGAPWSPSQTLTSPPDPLEPFQPFGGMIHDPRE